MGGEDRGAAREEERESKGKKMELILVPFFSFLGFFLSSSSFSFFSGSFLNLGLSKTNDQKRKTNRSPSESTAQRMTPPGRTTAL